MADWKPPVITEDYGHKARVVTQADVDSWLLMERRYNDLVRIIQEDIVPQIGKANGNG